MRLLCDQNSEQRVPQRVFRFESTHRAHSIVFEITCVFESRLSCCTFPPKANAKRRSLLFNWISWKGVENDGILINFSHSASLVHIHELLGAEAAEAEVVKIQSVACQDL